MRRALPCPSARIARAVQYMTAPLHSQLTGRRRQFWFFLAAMLCVSALIAACSGPTGNGPSTTATPSGVPLAKLHWCGKPFMLFVDAAPTPTPGTTPTTTSGTPVTLDNWSQVQPRLGFTVYLSATLPPNTCLVSAQGTIDDPIRGGFFAISYRFSNNSSLSISETPQRTQKPDFQCISGLTTPQATSTTKKGSPTPAVSPTPTQAPSPICTGVHDKTNIFFSMQGDQKTLQNFFNSLQPNVKWVPAS